MVSVYLFCAVKILILISLGVAALAENSLGGLAVVLGVTSLDW